MDPRQILHDGPAAPRTRAELLAALDDSYRVGAAFWKALPVANFYSTVAPHWSAADNLRHLVKSHAPVATALRLPRWVLRLVAGRAPHAPEGYTAIRDRYRQVLTDGGGAGNYAPSARALPGDMAADRARLLGQWQALGQRLVAGARRWDDEALDRCRLPHPLLGKLCVRDMLQFVLYHQYHHLGNVARRFPDTVISVAD